MSVKRLKKSLKIGHANALFFSVMFLLMFPLISMGLFYVTEAAIKKILKEEFQQSVRMVENQFELLSQTSNLIARSLAEDFVVHALHQASDAETVNRYLNDKREELQVDQLVVVDASGKIKGQSGFFVFDGTTLKTVEIVEKTLKSQSFDSVLMRQGDAFVYYTSSPFYKDGKLEGIVLIGLGIGDELMRNIKHQTDMEFSIVGDRVVAATSFDFAGEKKWTIPVSYAEYQWLLQNFNEMSEVVLNNKHYYIIAKPLEMVDDETSASLMLAYDTEHIQKTTNTLRWLVVLVLLIGFAITIGYSLFIGKKFGKIVQKMIRITGKIGKGEFQARITPDEFKEFNVLGENLNAMAQALEKKESTIQEYLLSLEEKIAERTEQIERQKHYLNTILDLQPNMIILVQKKEVVFVNQAVIKFLNCHSLSEILGSNKLNQLYVDQDMVADESVQMTCHSYQGNEVVFSVTKVILEDVDSYFIIYNDITHYKSIEQKLISEAETDPLTGLMNRNGLNKVLSSMLLSVAQHEVQVCLAIIDIDNFKKINDTYGHVVGDYALQRLGKLLNDKTRSTDIVARWGGEEFVIVLYGINLKQAFKIVDTLRNTIAETPFQYFDHLTCSIGLTAVEEKDSISSLIQRADEGLYDAKAAGKNIVIPIPEI